LFGMIEQVYTDNDFKTDLFGFIIDLKDIYKEAGVNMGCFFIERHFKKEFRLNFCDINKLEMRKILNLNGYIDIIFNRMGDILIKPDMENLFSGLQIKISSLKRDLIVESVVPEEAINFVLNSSEFRELSYFLIKTGFKCGLFFYLAYNTLYVQLSEELGNYLPGDWPNHLI
jgi:hypothetical protein